MANQKSLSNQNAQRNIEVLNEWQFEYDDDGAGADGADDDVSKRVHILCDCINKIDEAYLELALSSWKMIPHTGGMLLHMQT